MSGPDEALWRVRPRLGLSLADLLRGAFVAALVFSAFLSVMLGWPGMAESPLPALTYLGIVATVLFYALVPVVLVALGLGALTALVMRRVAHQAWHLLAFGLVGWAILGAPTLLGEGPGVPWGLATSVAAVAGRASVWRRFVSPGRASAGGAPTLRPGRASR